MWPCSLNNNIFVRIITPRNYSTSYAFQSEDARDNFVVCGDPYNTFRDKLAIDLRKNTLHELPKAVEVGLSNDSCSLSEKGFLKGSSLVLYMESLKDLQGTKQVL